ncbi:hypothetical protein HanXRQr2_Chr01g0022281 [Helianthus annuus]|uniref:Secreted protein n=1 Tax=Helianthus annuus TaxID=4232 RepID=A0A9K3JV95_HELAN|nr:hypothetical protein HanXRQr2_Chr01g0022281 [Helianthus annuus]
MFVHLLRLLHCLSISSLNLDGRSCTYTYLPPQGSLLFSTVFNAFINGKSFGLLTSSDFCSTTGSVTELSDFCSVTTSGSESCEFSTGSVTELSDFCSATSCVSKSISLISGLLSFATRSMSTGGFERITGTGS